MSLGWAEVECAIVEWAQGKLEFEENQFIWRNQNLPQPDYPYVELHRDSLISIGVDETRETTDLSQPPGQEIALTTFGVREFTLTVNCYVDEANGSNDPDCDAMALMSMLQTSLAQISVMEAFCLAGLSIVEELAVVDLSQVVNGVFVSRASMDVRFRTTLCLVERTGYINTVQVNSEPCNPSGPSNVTGVALEVSGN